MADTSVRDRITRRRAVQLLGGSLIAGAGLGTAPATARAQTRNPELTRVVLGQAKAAG